MEKQTTLGDAKLGDRVRIYVDDRNNPTTKASSVGTIDATILGVSDGNDGYWSNLLGWKEGEPTLRSTIPISGINWFYPSQILPEERARFKCAIAYDHFIGCEILPLEQTSQSLTTLLFAALAGAALASLCKGKNAKSIGGVRLVANKEWEESKEEDAVVCSSVV